MSRKETDDPGAVAGACFNMTPMIDVTFQLIVVFLCSMKFRTLDQKIEAFLPRKVGMDQAYSPVEAESRVDVRLRRRPGEDATTLLLLGTRIGAAEADASWAILRDRLGGLRAKDPAVKADILVDPDVVHGDVVRVLDALRGAGLDDVTFRGTAMPRTDPFAPAR